MHTQSSPGRKGGEETTTLTSTGLPAHTHSVGLPDLKGTVSSTEDPFLDLLDKNIEIGDVSATLQVSTSSAGGGQPVQNLQPTLTMKYVIALNDIFPSRSRLLEENTNSTKTSGVDQERRLILGEPLLGQIGIFAGNFAPRGYAFCEGQELPINQFSALFSLLGTTYGGDGRKTFGLPNLNGRVVTGVGNGPGLTSKRLGQAGGSVESTLTLQNLPSHSHGVTLASDLTLSVKEGSGST